MWEYMLWAYISLFANTKSKSCHKLLQYTRPSLVVGRKCTDEQLGKCQAMCTILRAEVFSWRLKFILQNGVPVNELWWQKKSKFKKKKTSRILTYIFIQLQITRPCFIIIRSTLVTFKTRILWWTLFSNLCAIYSYSYSSFHLILFHMCFRSHKCHLSTSRYTDTFTKLTDIV